MDKFVTERLASEDFNLFDFVKTTPFGYEETTVPSGGKRHPCIGTTQTPILTWTPSPTQAGMCNYVSTYWVQSYILWIETGGSHWGADVPNSSYTAACP